MKKLLTILFAALLAGAMSLSFAACGENDPVSEAEAIEGKEVTAEQWAAAFEVFDANDSVYTIEATSVVRPVLSEPSSDAYETTATVKSIKNGAWKYEKTTETVKTGDQEFYYITEIYVNRRTNVTYYKDNGEGDEIETEEEYAEKEWEKGNDAESYYYSPIDNIPREFEEYAYSAERKGYLYQGQIEEGLDLVLKFDEEGKIVATVSYGVYEEGRTKQVTGVLFTYEAEEIVPPTVA